MVQKICYLLVECGLDKWEEHEREATAKYVLDAIEEAGMLPPNCTVKLIPDLERGGTKHSPTERRWDDEE